MRVFLTILAASVTVIIGASAVYAQRVHRLGVAAGHKRATMLGISQKSKWIVDDDARGSCRWRLLNDVHDIRRAP